ncbi:MAG TPA: hypothetical protein VLL77_06550, partial [Anaerolineales bacterium]|nr:hypothetical protein [Anaerolineales bacterium]
MNPVTRGLLDQVANPELAELALAWDALEEKIISIYRAGVCSKADELAFEQHRRAALQAHRRWTEALEPHWRASTIRGERVLEDPFALVLSLENAATIPGNRDLLRTLP